MIPLTIVISLFTIGTISILIDMIINPDSKVITVPVYHKPTLTSDDYCMPDDLFESTSFLDDNPLTSSTEAVEDNIDYSVIMDDKEEIEVPDIEGPDLSFLEDDLSLSLGNSILDSSGISDARDDDSLIINDNNDSIFEDDNFNTIELDASPKSDPLDIDDSLVIDIDKRLMDYDLILDPDNSPNKDLELDDNF